MAAKYVFPVSLFFLREEFQQQKRQNYPLFVDKGGGSLELDKQWGVNKEIPNVNIIDKKMDKPKGGWNKVDKGFLLLNLGTF